MKILKISALLVLVVFTGCQTYLRKPELVDGKYTLQVLIAELPQNKDAMKNIEPGTPITDLPSVQEVLRAPKAIITKHPLIYVSVGETVKWKTKGKDYIFPTPPEFHKKVGLGWTAVGQKQITVKLLQDNNGEATCHFEFFDDRMTEIKDVEVKGAKFRMGQNFNSKAIINQKAILPYGAWVVVGGKYSDEVSYDGSNIKGKTFVLARIFPPKYYSSVSKPGCCPK
jgi:hypothetical protein